MLAAPAECTRAHFASYPPYLTSLPAGYALLTPDDQAKGILNNKADDALRYTRLLANALRCAPEH